MLEPTVSDQGRRISCESHGFYSVKKKKKKKNKEKKRITELFMFTNWVVLN